VLLPAPVEAQFVKLRFVAIDMLGGAAVVSEADVGVAFGTRFGFADFMGGAARLGLEMDWWTAQYDSPAFEMRDIMGGLAIWREFTRGGLRPYLGGGVSIHWIGTSPVDGVDGVLPPEARALQGTRLGASGFAGFALRLSQTGAIWLLIEYRYTAISDVPFQELRAGLRLAGGSS
jgi:hypothetical protein